MGQRFRSLFKKKRNQEPSSPLPLSASQPYTDAPQSLLQTQLFSPTDDTLTFTHGSLLDDVLNGLKDREPPPTKEGNVTKLFSIVYTHTLLSFLFGHS